MTEQNANLEGLARDWAKAELEADTDFLGRTLADDFVAVGPRGFMLTKEQWLMRHASGNLTYQSLALDEVAIRNYGGAAVLTARQSSDAIYEDGDRRHEIHDDFRITMIFAPTGDGISIVGLQLSPIAGPPA
jgi:ketosteroid isomerase-like protein